MNKVAVIGCGAYMDNGYGCPYTNPEDMAKALEAKTGVKVIIGTHDYH